MAIVDLLTLICGRYSGSQTDGQHLSRLSNASVVVAAVVVLVVAVHVVVGNWCYSLSGYIRSMEYILY